MFINSDVWMCVSKCLCYSFNWMVDSSVWLFGIYSVDSYMLFIWNLEFKVKTMFKVLWCIFLVGCFQTACSSGLKDVRNDKLPIVMWHGMGKSTFSVKFLHVIETNHWIFVGDTCCFSFSLGSFKTFLEGLLGPNTYVKSIRIGNNEVDDFRSGYFVHPNTQIEMACKMIAEDPKLKNGYNAIGFSQGSQFL